MIPLDEEWPCGGGVAGESGWLLMCGDDGPERMSWSVFVDIRYGMRISVDPVRGRRAGNVLTRVGIVVLEGCGVIMVIEDIDRRERNGCYGWLDSSVETKLKLQNTKLGLSAADRTRIRKSIRVGRKGW